MSMILVEQNPHKILPIVDRAMILERSAIVYEAASAALRADPAALEAHLGVTDHGARRRPVRSPHRDA
jgi:branched-chain amino acid transport system ATP-binding protein